MWSRKLLKDKAKAILKVSYLKAFLVSMIIAIVGGLDNYNTNFVNHNSQDGSYSILGQNIGMFSLGNMLFKSIVIIVLFILAIRIFLGYALEVSGRRYFVKSAQNDINMNHLGYSFCKGR